VQIVSHLNWHAFHPVPLGQALLQLAGIARLKRHVLLLLSVHQAAASTLLAVDTVPHPAVNSLQVAKQCCDKLLLWSVLQLLLLLPRLLQDGQQRVSLASLDVGLVWCSSREAESAGSLSSAGRDSASRCSSSSH
jgi:hypothetical protein